MKRFAPWVLVPLLIAFPWLFMGYLAGDAVIHLIFAENALAGSWFAFNAGEPSAGETSPGYMLLVMALMKLVGQGYTPYAMVAVGYAAWLGTLTMWYFLLDKFYPKTLVPLLAVAVIGFMPGAVLNSVLGMENVLFALGVAVVFVWLEQSKALERQLPFKADLALGLGLGFLTLIRPEALFFGAVVLGWRWLMLAPAHGWVRSFFHAAAAGIVVLGVYGAMILAAWIVSGVLPFGGGLARLQLAISDGFMLGPIPVHGNLLLRMAAYAPLALAFVAGVVLLMRNGKDSYRALLSLAALLVLVFALLFSSVLPATHLARYTVFFWPLVVLVGTFGLMEGRKLLSPRIFSALLAVFLAGQGAVYAVEFYQRIQRGFKPPSLDAPVHQPPHPLDKLVHVVEKRVEETDKLLTMLRHKGPFPVSVGLVEVQLRYFIDSRISIRSMDGIVDSKFSDYSENGVFDYTGYMRARQVDYLLEYQDLNTRLDDWSPAMLKPLEAGTVAVHEGVRFDRLEGPVTKVTYPDEQQ